MSRSVPVVALEHGTNPARLCSRTKRRNHTVAACPNYISFVKVNADHFIRSIESSSVSIDPMAAVYALKAAAVLEVALGITQGFEGPSLLDR